MSLARNRRSTRGLMKAISKPTPKTPVEPATYTASDGSVWRIDYCAHGTGHCRSTDHGHDLTAISYDAMCSGIETILALKA